MKFLHLALRVGLGSVFVVSGFEKLTSPVQNFTAAIETFEILRGPSAMWLAQTLPWLELISGVLLVLGFWTRVSAWALWAMNTVFIGVLSSALLRKLPLDQCGCFGKAVTLTPSQMLAVDAVLWFLFLLFLTARPRAKSPELDNLFDRHA